MQLWLGHSMAGLLTTRHEQQHVLRVRNKSLEQKGRVETINCVNDHPCHPNRTHWKRLNSWRAGAASAIGSHVRGNEQHQQSEVMYEAFIRLLLAKHDRFSNAPHRMAHKASSIRQQAGCYKVKFSPPNCAVGGLNCCAVGAGYSEGGEELVEWRGMVPTRCATATTAVTYCVKLGIRGRVQGGYRCRST